MAGWGYRRHNSGPRLIYGQANRHSFFRGGGLDGRPRTPNDMPLWGRPSGARQGKMRNVRDKNLRRRVDDRRLREIESDEEDWEGLGVDQSYFNDEYYSSGAAPLSRQRNRRVLINDYASEHSEDEDGSDDGIGGVQLVLPDKEDRLARKASERIRSAQILGLKNVMLTESEYDALESKRKRDEVARTTGAPSSLTRGRPRNSVQLIEPARVQRGSVVRIRSPIPNYDNEELPRPEVATPPGILVPGSNDSLSYRPFPDSAVPPRPIYRSSRSGSGSASFHSQQQNTPLRSSQFYQPEVGYPLAQEASRPSSRVQPNHLAHNVPDDHYWNSWPRSASSQTSPPHSSQERPSYAQGRRNLSGPSDINSIGFRRGNPPSMPHPSSEPSLLYRAHHAPPNSEYLTDNDDGNEENDQRYGLKSRVTPYNQNYGVIDEREGYRRDWRRRSGR